MKDGSSDNSSRADLRFDATSIGRSRVGSVLDGLWDTTGFDITGVGVGIGYKKIIGNSWWEIFEWIKFKTRDNVAKILNKLLDIRQILECQ